MEDYVMQFLFFNLQFSQLKQIVSNVYGFIFLPYYNSVKQACMNQKKKQHIC